MVKRIYAPQGHAPALLSSPAVSHSRPANGTCPVRIRLQSDVDTSTHEENSRARSDAPDAQSRYPWSTSLRSSESKMSIKFCGQRFGIGKRLTAKGIPKGDVFWNWSLAMAFKDRWIQPGEFALCVGYRRREELLCVVRFGRVRVGCHVRGGIPPQWISKFEVKDSMLAIRLLAIYLVQ